MMQVRNEEDPLSPLWSKAQKAADEGDIPGLLFVWKALAEKGVWQVYARIGEVFERGAPSVPRDIDEALSWYRKAVFEGDDPIGHVGLGRAYYRGIGVPQDVVKAFKHFERAANTYGLPDAKIYLGLMYYRGVAVLKDVRRAERLFSEAAAAHYPVAYAYLARIALCRGRIIRAATLYLKGLRLGTTIAEKDPTDGRLLGL